MVLVQSYECKVIIFWSFTCFWSQVWIIGSSLQKMGSNRFGDIDSVTLAPTTDTILFTRLKNWMSTMNEMVNSINLCNISHIKCFIVIGYYVHSSLRTRKLVAKTKVHTNTHIKCNLIIPMSSHILSLKWFCFF